MWLRFARKTTTAAAQSGIVVLEGKIVADKVLSIPGSQTRPIFYEMTVESFRALDGRGRPGWNVDRVGEGKHDAYHAMLHALRRRYQVD